MRYPKMDDWWCRYLAAEAGVQVLNVDFRTGPYVTYPVSQEQAFDVAVAKRCRRHRRLLLRRGHGGGGGADGARHAGRSRRSCRCSGVPALDMATEKPPSHGMISAELRALVRRVYFPDVSRRSEPYASPGPRRGPDRPAADRRAHRRARLAARRRGAVRRAAAGGGRRGRLRHDPGVDHYFLTEDQPRGTADDGARRGRGAGRLRVKGSRVRRRRRLHARQVVPVPASSCWPLRLRLDGASRRACRAASRRCVQPWAMTPRSGVDPAPKRRTRPAGHRAVRRGCSDDGRTRCLQR